MSKVVFWIVVAPLAAAVIVFSVNNREDVVLDLWPLDLMTAPWPLNLLTEPLPVFSGGPSETAENPSTTSASPSG